jgi:transposase
MVGGETALEIRVLHRHGKGIREIAREMGSSRNTVRRYLRDESAARYKPRPPRATKLDPFKDYLVERLTSAAPERIPASVLLREVREVLYDNMRTVVLERHGYGRGRHRLHPGFLDFARHCGFQPRLCAPYRAQTKGKVERFIRYLRGELLGSAVQPTGPGGPDRRPRDGQPGGRAWLREVANARIHGTTGAIPPKDWSAKDCSCSRSQHLMVAAPCARCRLA